VRAPDSLPNDATKAQLVRLLAGVSLHGDQHLAEVERDLVQVDALLSEAIKKLCASFMAIHETIGLQQEALNGVLASGVAGPEQAARLQALRDEISQHVGAAVTGLQFQDMTSQLIGRMVQHLAGLRDVFGALGAEGTAALPESGSEHMLALLDSISERVGVHCADLPGVTRSSVKQRHMESGDIDLF